MTRHTLRLTTVNNFLRLIVMCAHLARFSSLTVTSVLSFQKRLNHNKTYVSSSSAAEDCEGSARQREQTSQESLKKPSSISELNWENFDFSDSPKFDKRFDGTASFSPIAKSKVTDVLSRHFLDMETLHQREGIDDIDLSAEFHRRHKMWQDLNPHLLEKATNAILPFIQNARKEKIHSVYRNRTRQTRFLFENPANPSNVWACLRTLDSFGIQNADVVMQSEKYKRKASLHQKRGMRVAVGSAKWLTLRNHLNIESALKLIKNEGYHIYCSNVNPESKNIRVIDWDESGKPVCIVMGNEERGISQVVKEMTDDSFYIPMAGFAESFNLSAATAITCAHLSASSDGNGNGPLRPGDIPEREHKVLLFQGYLNSVNRKTARAIFRKEGLVFPPEFNLS
jgi:tRNA G18 (ribose-2'-O)-methylase SpoU